MNLDAKVVSHTGIGPPEGGQRTNPLAGTSARANLGPLGGSITMKATRREFLYDAALAGIAAMFAGRVGSLTAAQTGVSTWASRIGLELYTVRDLMATDYLGVLEKVAGISYKEIEPAGGYGDLSPKAFRALLDRLGLSMPSTHSGGSGAGLELEKQLEGFQTMGIKYTEISGGGRGAAAGAGAAGRGAGRGPLPPGAYYDAGTGI